MRLMAWLDRGLGWLVVGANALASAFVLVLMVLVVADILGRYLFNRPVPMTYEVGSFLMVFIVFLALAYAQRMGAHIRVEFLTLHLSQRIRAILDVMACVLGAGLFAVIAYQSFLWAWTSWQIGDYVAGVINIPRYPSQLVVPLGAAILCLQFIADAVRRVGELRRPPRPDRSGP